VLEALQVAFADWLAAPAHALHHAPHSPLAQARLSLNYAGQTSPVPNRIAPDPFSYFSYALRSTDPATPLPTGRCAQRFVLAIARLVAAAPCTIVWYTTPWRNSPWVANRALSVACGPRPKPPSAALNAADALTGLPSADCGGSFRPVPRAPISPRRLGYLGNHPPILLPSASAAAPSRGPATLARSGRHPALCTGPMPSRHFLVNSVK